MNIRHIIQNAIEDYISIEEEDIEGAVRAVLENLDITSRVQYAIESLLPDALEEFVEEVIDDEIADAVVDAVDALRRSL